MVKEQKQKIDIIWKKNNMKAAIINKFGGPDYIETVNIAGSR